MRLIYKHIETDNCTYSNEIIIPFEYSSKEDFIIKLLEEWDKSKNNGDNYIRLFKYYDLYEIDINEIENKVESLEDWFRQERLNVF